MGDSRAFQRARRACDHRRPFPAVAAATPAEDEYDLNLPEADGQSNDPAPQSAEDSSSPSAPSTPSPHRGARHR